jgi:hypothetical protein
MPELNLGALITAISALTVAIGAIFVMREQLAQARKQLEELRATDLKQADMIGELKGEFKVRDERLAQMRKELDETRNDMRGAQRAFASPDGTGRHAPLALPRPPK